MPQSIPRVLAILPGWMPSTLMNVVKPMFALERAGRIHFQLALETYLRRPDLNWADLVIFCRNLEPRYAHILDWVQKDRLPFIYDIDDNLFDMPPEKADSSFDLPIGRTEQLHRYLQSAATVRVYSPRLLDRVRRFNPTVTLVDPPLDWDLIPPSITRSSHPNDPVQPVRIVYATSRNDDLLYRIFAPALRQILLEYPDQVKAVFWGMQPRDFAGLSNVTARRFLLNYNQFLRLFSRAGFDIGLAPLPNDPFHSAKTNNKFREYGACGIAGIYSDTPVYSESVVDGVTGLLVENDSESWYKALDKLVQDRELRCRIGESSRQQLLGLYPPGVFSAQWLAQIESTLAQASTPSSSPPIFVAPQDVAAVQTSRFGRAFRHLLTHPRLFLTYAVRHLTNLYWLVRLNLLKHL